MKRRKGAAAICVAFAISLVAAPAASSDQPTCFPPGKASSPACDAQGHKGDPRRTDDGPGPFEKQR